MQLGLVETRAVAENAGVLAETFAMVRGDDQPGSLQDPAPVQLVDQLAELLIEIRDAIVIGVGGECHALGRDSRLVELPPVLDQEALIVVGRLDPETMKPSRRQLIGIMGVEVVQESEKRPLRLRAAGQPVEKLAIDHRRPLAIGVERLPEAFDVGQQSGGLQPILREIRRSPGSLPGLDSTSTAVLSAVSSGKMKSW